MSYENTYELMNADRLKARSKIIEKDLDKLLPNLRSLERDNNLRALADECPTNLGKNITTKGYKAIDMLCDKISSLFPNQGHGYHVKDSDMIELLNLYGLSGLEYALQPAFDQLIDVRTFLTVIAKYLKLNPIFVLLGAEYHDLSPENKTKFFQSVSCDEYHAQEIRRSVIYCALINCIAVSWTFETTRLASDQSSDVEMFCMTATNLLNWTVNASGWDQYTNSFEEMKINDLSVEEKIDAKYSYREDGELLQSNGSMLQTHIIEAIYQDTIYENDDNAHAGFELLCETYYQTKIVCLEQDYVQPWFYQGSPMGINTYNMAFPKVWSNLHLSWNACYFSQFPESPYYFAALLPPCVCGFYQEMEKGLYLDYRDISLWFHYKFIQISRASYQNEHFSQISWLSDLATVMWSRINKKAGAAYQYRVDKNLKNEESTYHSVSYLPTRAIYLDVFKNMSNYTIVNRNLTSSPDHLLETFYKMLDIHNESKDKIYEKLEKGLVFLRNKPVPQLNKSSSCLIM